MSEMVKLGIQYKHISVVNYPFFSQKKNTVAYADLL